MKIFISYSSKDLLIAKYLEEYLRNDFDVWLDNRVEANWSKEISSNLVYSDIIILLWTNNAKDSVMVNREWLTARALEKPIKPIIFLDSPKLPYGIANLQGIKFEMNSTDIKSNKTNSILKSILNTEFRLKERLYVESYDNYRYEFDSALSKSNLPFLPNHRFVGRSKELRAYPKNR